VLKKNNLKLFSDKKRMDLLPEAEKIVSQKIKR